MFTAVGRSIRKARREVRVKATGLNKGAPFLILWTHLDNPIIMPF